LETHGYSIGEVVGHSISEFTEEISKRRLATSQASPGKKKFSHYEIKWRKKNGRKITAIFSPRPIYDDKGNFRGSVAVITDITQRRKVEDELNRSREVLRKLSLYLQSVREKEGKRIAREIHDELGQALTALKMDVSWISQKIPWALKDKGRLLRKMESMSKLIDTTIQTVQKISAELRPGLLDDLGLVPAVEWLAQDFEKRSDVQCSLNLEFGRSDFDPDCSTAIFRIIQEALTNVARHAKATQVSIELRENAGFLELKVRDNGKGTTEEVIHSPESLGLIGMRERLYPLSGTLKLESFPNKGTVLSVLIPLKASRDA
jgi:two-component system sensor histidine kinase UhpB